MVKKGRKATFVPYSNEAVETISQKKLQEQESAKTQCQGDTSSNKKPGKIRGNKKGGSPSVTTVEPDSTNLKPADNEEIQVQGNEHQNIETEESKQIEKRNNSQKPKEPAEKNSPNSTNNNVSDATQHTSAEIKNISQATSHKNDEKSKDTPVKATNSTNTESTIRPSKPHPDNPAWIIKSKSHPSKHPFGSTLNPNASEFRPTSNSVDQGEMNSTIKTAKPVKDKQFVPQEIEVTFQKARGYPEDLQKLSLRSKTPDTYDQYDNKTSREGTPDHDHMQSVSNEVYPSCEKQISSDQTPNPSGFSVDCKNSTSEWSTEQSTHKSITNASLSDQHDDRSRLHDEAKGYKKYGERMYNNDREHNDHQTRSDDRRRTQREFPNRGRGRNNEEKNVNYNNDYRQNKVADNIPSTYQSTQRSYDDPSDRSYHLHSKRNTDRNQNPNNFRGNTHRGHKEFGPGGNSRSNQNRYKDGQHFGGGSKFDDESNQTRRSDNWRVPSMDNTRTGDRYDNSRNENKRFPRGPNSYIDRGRYNTRDRNNPAGRNDSYNRRQSSDAEIITDDSSKDSSSNYHITDDDSSDVPERKVDLVDPSCEENWDTVYQSDSVNKPNEAISNQIAPVQVGPVETNQEQTWETSGGNQDDVAWNWNDEVSEANSRETSIAESVNDMTQHNTVQSSSVAEVGVPSKPRNFHEDGLNKVQNTAAMPKHEKPRRSYENKRDPRMERANKSMPDWRSNRSSDASGSERNVKQTCITSYLENKDPSREKSDKDFDLWEGEWRKIKDFRVVKEIQGDLFQQPKDYSLAHCVAEDLRMGSGIAVDFKREFKNLPDLLDQRAKQGGLATLPDTENKRFVYYLVTKRESTGKPTYLTMWKSLNKMKKHIIEYEVKKLAVPRLGCGLDRLEWNRVKSMLEYLFRDIELDITVCNFQQDEDTPKKSFTCKYVFNESPITEIEPGTLIFYFSTESGDEDSNMTQMSKKFNYLSKFRSTKAKRSGDIIYSEDGKYGLCGCIVRRTVKDQISFKNLWICMQEVNKMNKKFGSDAFNYVAFQWVDENGYMDDSINEKIITVLINSLRFVEVYVCRGDFKDDEKQ